ncbi:MAG TPA: hypothetical protein VJ717_19545, partial [Gemmatimonadaceae bacterium]|nr:hypothetical protein [Gemmatimonadaceae bacterium]
MDNNVYDLSTKLRDAAPAEMRLLEAVAAVLNDVRPQQLDPAQIDIRREGPGTLLVVLPHRSLAGLALFIWRR